MPKLDSNVAAEVEKAESVASLIEEGTYEMVLTAVSATDKEGNPLVGKDSGQPYWNWEFTFPEDAPRYSRRKLWRITSLGANSAWLMKEHFDAFGVSPDTDTDDLIGKRALVYIGTRMRTDTNETQNTIKRVLPVDGVTPVTGGVKGASTKGAAKKDLF